MKHVSYMYGCVCVFMDTRAIVCVFARFSWSVAMAWVSSNLWAESDHINGRESEWVYAYTLCIHFYIYLYIMLYVQYTEHGGKQNKTKNTREKNQLVYELVRRVRSTGGWLVALRRAYAVAVFDIASIRNHLCCFHFS